jgi:hypothetical protein
MSVMQLSREHISALVKCKKEFYVYNNETNKNEFLSQQEAGQELLSLNRKTYCNRYNDMYKQKEFRMVNVPEYSPVQILKLYQCYQYNIDKNIATLYAQQILDAIYLRLLDLQPGYEEAEWSI